MIYRIKYRLYFNTILPLLLLLLFSCKTKEIAPTPLSQEIYDINTLIVDEDIRGLISLYPALKEHKDYAYHSILSDFNLENYSYEKLLELYYLSRHDSLLCDGFTSIIEKREYTIIDCSPLRVWWFLLYYREKHNLTKAGNAANRHNSLAPHALFHGICFRPS